MYKRLKAIVEQNKILYKLAIRVQRIFDKTRKPISGNNNKIKNDGVFLNVKLDIIGNNNVIEVKERSVLSDMMIYMRGDNHHLRIEKGCRIKGGRIWFEDEWGYIKIGEKTTIYSALLAVTEPKSKILIGKDCLFADDIEIRTGDSHSILDIVRQKRINYAQDISIGTHVWVGAKSTILKGVTIQDNSIVSFGAIVTRDVPPNTIVAGIPAKVVKENINWLRKRIYP